MCKAKNKNNITVNLHISRLIDKIEIKADPFLTKAQQERLGKQYLQSIQEVTENFLQSLTIQKEFED